MNRLPILMLALGAFLVGTAELVVGGVLHAMAEDLGVSIALAGQFITAYSLSFALGTPILIALTSRLGRKSLLLGSLAVFIAGSLLSWASTGYALMLVSRIILGLSAGVYTVVAVSSVTKLVPPERMGGAISMIALGFGSAMALGVPIGIAITGWWSWQAIFAGLAAVSLAVTLLLLRLLPQIEGDAPVPFRQRFSVLGNPVILSGLLISLLQNGSNSVLLTYLTPYLQEVLHLDASLLGAVMLTLGLVGMLGSRLGGIGVDRWGSVFMLVSTIAFAAVTLGLLPLVTASLTAGLLLVVLWFSSLFMSAPALQTYFIQQAPQSSNLVLSLNLSVIHLGLAAGAGAGGAAVNWASTVHYNPWIGSLAALLSLLAAFVSFSLRKRKAGGGALTRAAART
ncbi:MFS transporter [Paenibacillus mucilaginosus]|uniref:Major facilitator superfamily protein n=2 Tax=Paenibacillus mucilaginosus TaxID=61624 RepID=H6NRL7_9BACL|nr:MFS transporter [Paenibacillus mucilaginosus]AEI38997.1 major facilitator superfamily MFS_1 [Paenibacillus mucilaginosus KNP414]AFC27299.1 major facilitator superfamily protein [Paenibacillus mucilaginosus 3016]MCG7216133.1 MFS transporter [Paenibacillus mucilaginosus]WDM28038.1 MFS transporter [Paenibacillus mucilaginosus]WFA16213.1 MFS transporter [Paenibacillus mucilaginosus]